ncbi:porin [Acidisphaera sp. L21]|uniref:porin n=1 Tax=Acidisphaera sp. L21 TaxID=1641851 RepID=UPI001C201D47|nr:porin [Acidisphaera sp. L21]
MAGQAAAQPVATAPAPATEKAWAPPTSFSDWASSIKFWGQVEAGIVGNTQDPNNGANYGALFTDKANRPILNQLMLTLERDIDPKATSYDFGFKLQGMYGSDARIIHSLGLFDHAIHDRNQLDIVEANVTAHTPWLFEGGIDFKGGLYPTPLGFEVIDPKANPFYTHSYIFNYGLPYKHLGLLSTAHVTSVLDLYLGIDTGTNVTIFDGDDNRRPGGIAGFGLNLLDGKLTLLALTHIGPENSKRNTPFANSAMRYYNDVTITYKATDALSFTTELNYIKDDGFRAEGYGAAQYISYALTDTLTLNGRAEIWRDNSNFFVSTPVNNLDFVNFERGYSPANFYTAVRPTTYSALTAGVTYKPAGIPAPINNLMVRPELRYDRSLSGSKPYGDGNDKGVFTISADVILGF